MKGNIKYLRLIVFLHVFFSKLELRDAFNLFDRDQSGAISSSELSQILIALHFKPTDTLLRKVMKEMDTDGMFVFHKRKI